MIQFNVTVLPDGEVAKDWRALDTAEECARWLVRYGVTPRQIRDWARRGNITRHGDRYDMCEIADYLDNRPDADNRRARCAALRRLPL